MTGRTVHDTDLRIPGWTFRAASGRVSARVAPRSFATGCVLLAALLAASVVALMTGDYPATPGEIVRTLVGDGPPGLEVVLGRFRLPRLLVAIGVGIGLGAAGAIFQSLARNPLGSPEVIGFTTGASTGALLVLLVLPATALGAPAGAVLGGLVTAAIVYSLAFKRGVQGDRLVLVGIGVNAVLFAANGFLMSRASLEEAQDARVWLIGSVNGRSWESVGPLWAMLPVLLAAALALSRKTAVMEMGDEAAIALGVPVERVRLGLVVCGVGLTGAAVAAAGPVVFVALAAPQIARRLARCGAPPLLLAALTGALLMVLADLAAQRLFAPTQLPVGVATGAVGGIYLMWLLSREWRKGG
ncbi:iron complex transport system permease protein [Actinocorallia herbida]|uniref:Iron complex transport system permease protein n=1 Tax=Actinocorallia herbida TaxID=58109 RepID=A0A3N1D0Z6_9ACTN|nr:iron chelate uptake ABC transporter family permease subunit [Actinocorallia herbida]ROO87205.1 iron complex transport system permease protein [Actinocorallia herbida]